MIELSEYVTDQAIKRLYDSKVTLVQFWALRLLIHEPGGSSEHMPRKGCGKLFLRGRATAAGYLYRKRLVDFEVIEKKGVKNGKGIFIINDVGREFHHYIMTGEKGPILSKVERKAKKKAKRRNKKRR